MPSSQSAQLWRASFTKSSVRSSFVTNRPLSVWDLSNGAGYWLASRTLSSKSGPNSNTAFDNNLDMRKSQNVVKRVAIDDDNVG